MSSVDAARRKKERKKRRSTREAGSAGANGRAEAGGKKKKSALREWLDALVFAIVVMLIVRTLFFDLFRIPTPSMEKNLLVGDYLFVSKLHYGTRMPMGICVPFTDACVPGVHFPYTRLPGFSEVERGDAIVFNWPVEEKRVDRRMHYIKRVVGMPGDTLSVQNKVVHIDGTAMPLQDGQQQFWYVYLKDQKLRLPTPRLRELGVSKLTRTADPRIYRIQATPAAADSMAQWRIIDRVTPAVAPADGGYSGLMYPPGQGYTPDDYGPVVIPEAGRTVTLTAENWPYLEPVIRRYEARTPRRLPDGRFVIDGEPATTYTFQRDYFFVMGDNRDDSEDSRFWGFVPMDHVVGKAVLIYFSWDAEGSPFLLGQIRYSRLFKGIG